MLDPQEAVSMTEFRVQDVYLQWPWARHLWKEGSRSGLGVREKLHSEAHTTAVSPNTQALWS
jgi:hypothetical protein